MFSQISENQYIWYGEEYILLKQEKGGHYFLFIFEIHLLQTDIIKFTMYYN